MRDFIFMLVFFSAFTFSACNRDHKHEVRILIRADHIGVNDTVFITGNNPQIGNWNPGYCPMKNINDHVWEFKASFSADTVIEYKFTLGSWDHEPMDSMGRPLPNFKLKVGGDTLVSYEFSRWKGLVDMEERGGITGGVRYHDLEMDGLLSRKLVVWLPPGYEKSEKRYPVIYMLDGQNLFDPSTSFLGTDWQIDETAHRLISEDQINPIIIVGIYNTADRSEEYHDTSKGKLFRQALVSHIKPLIDNQYRTRSGREYTVVGGSSSGGLASFILAWENPEIFSTAICLSPAFKINEIDYVRQVDAYQGDLKPLVFYIFVGGDELDRKLKPGVDDMVKVLKRKGYQEGDDLYYYFYPEDSHNEISWGSQVPGILKSIFKK